MKKNERRIDFESASVETRSNAPRGGGEGEELPDWLPSAAAWTHFAPGTPRPRFSLSLLTSAVICTTPASTTTLWVYARFKFRNFIGHMLMLDVQ